MAVGRIEKARKRVEDLKAEEWTLREQASRHRSFGESDSIIKRELTRVRSDLHYARRELRFSQRICQ